MFSGTIVKMVLLLITDDCINCRACYTVCPSEAIYPGGKDFKLNNKKHKASVPDHYYIAPGKCDFCEGVYKEPECVSVCPMDTIKIVNKN